MPCSFLLCHPLARPDWVIGRRRGSRLAGGTGRNVRLHICPVQPRQSRFCCWVIHHRRRRRSSRGPCSSVCSARSVRPRGRIWSSVDLFARGGRDLPVSACPFATEWTGKKERNARRKKRVAHLCPVSRGGFKSLSVRQIVLCLPIHVHGSVRRSSRATQSLCSSSSTRSRFCQTRRLKRTTSASWGSLGSGVERSDWSETRQVRRVKTGLQLDLRMSRQMKPVWDEMSANAQKAETCRG